MSADRLAFLNRVRSLHCIDSYLLPELTDEEWPRFRDDPARFFMRTDDTTAAAIWREVEKRQARRQGETPGAPELLEAVSSGDYVAKARKVIAMLLDDDAKVMGVVGHLMHERERSLSGVAAATIEHLLSLTSLQKVQATDGGAEEWQPIETARKDGSTIWALLRSDIYPTLKPGRDDLERWNGLQVPLRHPGVTSDGFDAGWNIAAPVGHGGFPDGWIAGWVPLRSLPSAAGTL